MNTEKFRTPFRRDNLLAAAVGLLLAAVLGFGFASSTAQGPGQGGESDEGEAKEREIEFRMAAHLPFKAKLKNLEKMKDLKNDEWLGDLELEITNTGTKPIYYLYFALLLPKGVRTVDGSGMAYSVRYGRIQLVDLTEPLRSDDVPILPGESAAIKLEPERLTVWKSMRAKGKVINPKKLSFWFQLLNHGDGTGYIGPHGTALPNKDTQRSSSQCRDGKADVAVAKEVRPPSPRLPTSSTYFALTMPVNFLAGNFFAPRAPAPRPTPARDICCDTSGCERLKIGFMFCICTTAEVRRALAAPTRRASAPRRGRSRPPSVPIPRA
jgi:hypothetical protein